MKSTQYVLPPDFAPQAHNWEASTTQGSLNAMGGAGRGRAVSNDL